MENENKKEEKFVPHAISNGTFGHYREQQEKIQDAKELLRENGYYIYSLYHVEDVQSFYECTDAEAMDILDQALDNDGTANQVWESIRYFAEDMGFKEK